LVSSSRENKTRQRRRSNSHNRDTRRNHSNNYRHSKDFRPNRHTHSSHLLDIRPKVTRSNLCLKVIQRNQAIHSNSHIRSNRRCPACHPLALAAARFRRAA